VRKHALRWIVASGLLCAGSLAAAEPLQELQVRLAGLRDTQPIRLKVDIEMQHRGTAPLHLNDAKLRGTAIVRLDRQGIEVRERRREGDITQFSLWQEPKEGHVPLLDEESARQLADPVVMIEPLLAEGVRVSDEAVTWQDRPARLLVIRPRVPEELAEAKNSAGSDRPALAGDAKLWLDENGRPLALERSVELRLASPPGDDDRPVRHLPAGGRAPAGRRAARDILRDGAGAARAGREEVEGERLAVALTLRPAAPPVPR
jgi:hypothetical protein